MQVYPLQAKFNGAGTATAQVPTQALGKRWVIKMISVNTSSFNSSKCDIYLNNFWLMGTSSGNADTASGDPPVPFIPGKDSLKLVWTGGTPNETANAFIWYDESAA